MRQTAARPKTRRTLRPTAVGLVVVAAAIIGTVVHQSASSPAPSFSDVLRGDHGGTATEADGALPDGVTVFDDQYPGVANLDPDLLRALREAATAAADDGIDFDVNSGWRSPEYQNQLLREAVYEYGSEAEAARWVATADTSPHVSGDAVDIGHSDATAWLSEHGAAYGLCQIYRNSPGTTNCAPKPSITVARACMPTPRTIRGCSGDRRCRPIPPQPRRLPAAPCGSAKPGHTYASEKAEPRSTRLVMAADH